MILAPCQKPIVSQFEFQQSVGRGSASRASTNSIPQKFIPIPYLTTRVCPLKLGDLLIIEREGSTTVPFFTDEVEPGRELMTT